jgi:hypothetical protein
MKLFVISLLLIICLPSLFADTRPSVHETEDLVMVQTSDGRPVFEYRKKPSEQASIMPPITPARGTSIHSIHPPVKLSPGTMHLITLISTACSLPGPSQVFGESRLNFGTRRSNSEIFASNGFLGKPKTRNPYPFNLNRSLPQAKIPRKRS